MKAKKMSKSRLFLLVGTAPVWILWLLLLLVPVSNTAAHKTRTQVCHQKDMPTVVLARNKETGIFSVVQRYAPGEHVPPLNEWTWYHKVRRLEKSDYHSLPSSAVSTRTTQRQHGGLRSQRRSKDPFSCLELIEQPSSSPPAKLDRFDQSGNRLLEPNPLDNHGDDQVSNETMSVILQDVDLFYARLVVDIFKRSHLVQSNQC